MTSIRERNKELILRAASEEFADKGFAATKTSDIAAKAGLPKPNVYYYFKSKENLYREVLESIIEPLLAASSPFNQPGHPSEVLTAYIRSKIRISRELPHASKVFASEKVDPHHLLFSIWAATQTYADFDWQISSVTGKTTLDDSDYEAAAQTITRLVLKGCEVSPAPSTASELVTKT
ncbi:MAG: TetR family transcriptional regulator [Pseudomonas sp. 34-62-33]|nr:MAG: TetR family transcriptional regulator [Pseudomonas sp. 34-62-33]